MSETYNVDEYISPETGERKRLPDPDEGRKRIIIPVDVDESTEKKPVSPLKKQPVKKPIPESSLGRKTGTRHRRATRPSPKDSPVEKTATTSQNIKKFTILVPDDLLRKFRMQALQDGKTYSALGVEAIEILLKARRTSQE